MSHPICPICSNPALAKETSYGIRHSCCGLWSWDGKPLVDAETHDARKAAHAVFDPLWQSKRLKRKEAYRQLARHMGLSGEECHIALMTKDQAVRVPDIARLILGRLLQVARPAARNKNN